MTMSRSLQSVPSENRRRAAGEGASFWAAVPSPADRQGSISAKRTNVYRTATENVADKECFGQLLDIQLGTLRGIPDVNLFGSDFAN